MDDSLALIIGLELEPLDDIDLKEYSFNLLADGSKSASTSISTRLIN